MSNARWGGGGREAMVELARMFPTLAGAAGIEPWDPEALMRWSATSATSGGAHAVAFLLNVWNSRTDWRALGAAELGIDDDRFSFNCAEAIACWDVAHRAAFLVWCREPFHP